MGQGNPVPQLTGHAKRLGLKAAPGSHSSGLTAGSTLPAGVEKEPSLELPMSPRQGHPELHPQWEGSASQQPWVMYVWALTGIPPFAKLGCQGLLLAVWQHGDPATFDPITPGGQGISHSHVPTAGICNF